MVRPSDQSEASGLVAERRRKLEDVRSSGVEPYPYSFDRTASAAGIEADFNELESGEESGKSFRLAGRLAARRGHGKAAFLDLRDLSGTIQLHAREDVLGEERFNALVNLDLGDLVGVGGEVFKTRRGELSIKVMEWQLLAKAVRPLPDKYHGLEDVETRYRQRELDLAANRESRELFTLRSKAIAATRRFLDERGFLEVETPVLQPIYGGALAKPFTTHHNVLDRKLYLRIATELYLKRLIVGGLEKVYEIGKDFRNEGLSFKHNPEFTMLESYEAYADYLGVAGMVEQMVAYVAGQTLAATSIERDGEAIDLKPPWRKLTLQQAIEQRTGIDIYRTRDHEGLLADCKKDGIELKAGPKESWAKLVDELLSKYVEPELKQPTFILDYPIELSPFAKRHREHEGLVERFECFIGGIEIANAFSELNDPEDQKTRFLEQAEELAGGDEEAQPYDEEFIEALEYGMPPTGGLGVGLDRLVMILSGAHSIREVILFPTLRERA